MRERIGTSIIIRKAQEKDAVRLAALAAQTFIDNFGYLYAEDDLQAYLAEAYDVEKHREEILSPEHAVWVVEDLENQHSFVGFCHLGVCKLPLDDVQDKDGEVWRFYMKSEYQGYGIGQSLFKEMLKEVDLRYTRLFLGVWSENHDAQRFYQRFGFEKIGEYKFKVGNHYDHEFIMQKRPNEAGRFADQ